MVDCYIGSGYCGGDATLDICTKNYAKFCCFARIKPDRVWSSKPRKSPRGTPVLVGSRGCRVRLTYAEALHGATDARFLWDNYRFHIFASSLILVLGGLARQHILRTMERYFNACPRILHCLVSSLILLNLVLGGIASPISLVDPTQSLVLLPGLTNSSNSTR